MDKSMTILSSLRRRSADKAAAHHASSADGSEVDPAGPDCPIDGYDRLNDREVMGSLSKRSQVELGAIEKYEFANKRRINVLDKLRYMRGKEPISGYDGFSSEEIVTALETADLASIKRVRAYERKFANRPEVLEQVIRVHHRTIERDGAPPAPGQRASSAARKTGAANGPLASR